MASRISPLLRHSGRQTSRLSTVDLGEGNISFMLLRKLLCVWLLCVLSTWCMLVAGCFSFGGCDVPFDFVLFRLRLFIGGLPPGRPPPPTLEKGPKLLLGNLGRMSEYWDTGVGDIVPLEGLDKSGGELRDGDVMRPGGEPVQSERRCTRSFWPRWCDMASGVTSMLSAQFLLA